MQPDSSTGNRVQIISEIHPQHGGSLDVARTLILQSKLAGADFVKVQIYRSLLDLGDSKWEYLEISRTDLKELMDYARQCQIELFASVFNRQALEWCEALGMKRYKIASRTVADKDLCAAIIATGKPTMVSLGKHDMSLGFPYAGDDIANFYCVAQYPALLENIKMPHFEKSGFMGYSDHSFGIAACLHAVSRGARILEKHFTLSKAAQKSSEMAHFGAIDYDELCLLRKLADGIAAIPNLEQIDAP